MSIAPGLGEVLRAPYSDAARLRYAEQCGDAERAALIPVQLQHAQLQRQLLQTPLQRWPIEAQTAYYKAQRLAQRLLDQHAARWTAQLPAGAKYLFGRGCVECVDAPAAWWVEHGESVAAVEPILGFCLSAVTPELLAATRQKPWTCRLVALALSPAHPHSVDSAVALLKVLLNTLPDALSWLDLRRLALQLPHLEALAHALTSPTLRWVGLPELVDFPDAGQPVSACDEPIVETDWNHTGRLIDWYSSPLVTHLDRLSGVAAWRHFRPADWSLLLPPPMTLFVPSDF